jgi:hypothetical protein
MVKGVKDWFFLFHVFMVLISNLIDLPEILFKSSLERE